MNNTVKAARLRRGARVEQTAGAARG